MSQGFKLKYDQMREGNPTKQEVHQDNQSRVFEESYSENSNARNICFVWMDGKRIFMNYSYLVSGEYSPEDNIVTLVFTTATIILKGVNLESLFYDVMNHMIKQIMCTDPRYNIIGEDDTFVVNEIQLMKDPN